MESKELQKCNSFFCEKILSINWSSPVRRGARDNQYVAGSIGRLVPQNCGRALGYQALTRIFL